MVFGEIVEPMSRAMWDDDTEDYSKAEKLELQINGSFTVPSQINKLIIGETAPIIKFLQKSVLYDVKLLAEIINAGIFLYKIGNDCYVIIYKPSSAVICGNITIILKPWLESVAHTYVLTSTSTSLLQNYTKSEPSGCILLTLSTDATDCLYPKLEVPNLVTGLSASVLSYCVHKELTCTLYISFFEDVGLDSRNTRVIFNLLKHLQIKPLRNYICENAILNSNLYL